jgi:hypothetical protein
VGKENYFGEEEFYPTFYFSINPVQKIRPKGENVQNIIATWRTPGIFKADAQTVYNELREIGDEFVPEDVVEAAKDESKELHKCFEWDNDTAAEKYRLHQARLLTSNLVFRKATSEEEDEPIPVRIFNKTEPSGGYKPPERVFTQADEYEKLLKRATSELHQFKIKYSMLKELDYILSLID